MHMPVRCQQGNMIEKRKELATDGTRDYRAPAEIPSAPPSLAEWHPSILLFRIVSWAPSPTAMHPPAP